MNDQTLLEYIDEFKQYNVGIISASPISMGLLSNRGPPPWHPATPEIKNACQHAAEYCQSVDVDISKLAMNFSLGVEEVATTLVSTASLANLQKNIAAVMEELNDVEKQAMDHILENYFRKVKEKTWEGVEVAEYWNKMKQFKSSCIER